MSSASVEAALRVERGELEAARGRRIRIDAQHNLGMLEPCTHQLEAGAPRAQIGGLGIEIGDSDPDVPYARTPSFQERARITFVGRGEQLDARALRETESEHRAPRPVLAVLGTNLRLPHERVGQLFDA